ncbi:MAG: ChaN family lipoprotein [Phycisphaerales bacterium JB039]
MLSRCVLGAVLTGAALLLAACASTGTAEAPKPAPQIREASGAELAFQRLVDDALAADVIIVGEEHDNEAAQALAADLWDSILDVYAQSSSDTLSPALCLEFFERDEQLVLDDYLDGLIDRESEFKRESGRTSGNYPEGHRRMVEASKEAGVPVFGANAPRRYARYAGDNGYDALREQAEGRQALFIIPDQMPPEDYRERFFAIMEPMMEAHGGEDPDAIEGFYLSQVLKDATMADAVADAVLAGYQPVLLVVGRFHSDHNGATVSYLRAALPEARILTLSVTREEEDEPAADVVILAP